MRLAGLNLGEFGIIVLIVALLSTLPAQRRKALELDARRFAAEFSSGSAEELILMSRHHEEWMGEFRVQLRQIAGEHLRLSRVISDLDADDRIEVREILKSYPLPANEQFWSRFNAVAGEHGYIRPGGRFIHQPSGIINLIIGCWPTFLMVFLLFLALVVLRKAGNEDAASFKAHRQN